MKQIRGNKRLEIQSTGLIRRGIAIRLIKAQFQSGDLKLEGLLQVPDNAGARPAVVVCHPHPLYGGSMDNNVVNALCDALVNKSIAAFKFNFRGVGGSQGAFSAGTGEQEDVKAAISFLVSHDGVDPARLGLAGYSAGAAWGLAAAYQDKRIKALAAISPPLSIFDFNFLQGSRQPRLMISGSRDEHVQAQDLLAFCRDLAEPRECTIIEGADHSWWGYETAAAETVTNFFSKVL